jgi:Raf kinase inhibitor-like YbhB/YbcL family protein
VTRLAVILLAAFIVLPVPSYAKEGGMKKMEITSPEFKNNEMMPERFGYDKDNVNPELDIESIPSGAHSLVLIVDDPDAPLKAWVHWVMYDIPIIDRIEEDSAPGTQGVTDYKQMRYGGPFPPSGTHRYFFKLYALDKKLGLKEGLDKKAVERAMEGHILEEAELVGLYKK